MSEMIQRYKFKFDLDGECNCNIVANDNGRWIRDYDVISDLNDLLDAVTGKGKYASDVIIEIIKLRDELIG